VCGVKTEHAPVAPPPPPPPRCPPPKAVPPHYGTDGSALLIKQQTDENDYIEPQMVVDNTFDDVLESLDSKVSAETDYVVVFTCTAARIALRAIPVACKATQRNATCSVS